MKTYFYLQCKRVLRLLPGLICVVLILFFGLSSVFDALVRSDRESSEASRFRVGLVGNVEGNYLEMGLSAVETFDDSRFMLEIVRFDGEEEALNSLRKRDLVAVFVIPDGFIEAAFRGEILPIRYVTVPGNSGLVPLFKDEITSLISGLLTAAQKGVYGTYDVFAENGLKSEAQGMMDRINLEYVELVFLRSKVYSVTELGVSDGLDLPAYFFCGISVFLVFLICIPFAVLFVHRDRSLGRILSSKGCGALQQVSAEFAAMLCGAAVLFCVVFLLLSAQDGGSLSSVVTASDGISVAWKVFPVLLTATAFGFLIFELTWEPISCILLHFFAVVSLCYVSGCLYPIYFFPDAVQNAATVLPTGIARSHLAACISDRPCFESGILLTGYAVLFFSVAVCVRRLRLKR